MRGMKVHGAFIFALTVGFSLSSAIAQSPSVPLRPSLPVILHAARLFEVASGHIVSPGEI